MLYLWPDWFFETMHISRCDLCEKSHDFPLYILYSVHNCLWLQSGFSQIIGIQEWRDRICVHYIRIQIQQNPVPDPDPAESNSGSGSSRIQFRIQIQQNPVQDPAPAESSSGSRSSRIQFRIQIQQNPVPDQIATAKNHLKHLVQLSKSAIKSPDPFPKAYPFISIHILLCSISFTFGSAICRIFISKQGWAPRSFPFWTHCSFAFF